MKTAVFRGGCLTGPAHSPAQLHGFLAYLVQAIVSGQPYTIIGYGGKQVRDNIHSADVVSAFHQFFQRPRCGEVYNIGGGRHSNVSVLEAVAKVEAWCGRKARIRRQRKARIGDHIWYVSDMARFQSHYPRWKHTYDGDQILEELCRMAAASEGRSRAA
jgi:CDP-paratose 2-epimerase